MATWTGLGDNTELFWAVLSHPIDIYFGSMSAESIAPATCLVIEGNAVSSNQQLNLICWRKPTHSLLAT
jgi:hypothetical protein